mmetsp:Transcript_4743/g.10791  ORF Transcript_4743/g.10791 Transcript_4743/m.10791 type:complete len:226 (+) Transcript_4743:1408-2085(+)
MLLLETAAITRRSTAMRCTRAHKSRLTSQLIGQSALPGGTRKFRGRAPEAGRRSQCDCSTMLLLGSCTGARRISGSMRVRSSAHLCGSASSTQDSLSVGELREWKNCASAACRLAREALELGASLSPPRPRTTAANRSPKRARGILEFANRAPSQQSALSARTLAPTRVTLSCDGVSSSIERTAASSAVWVAMCAATRPATATAAVEGIAAKREVETYEMRIVSQ